MPSRLRNLRHSLDDPEAEAWARIAAEVLRQRHAKRLSQRELAELCGTTQSAIARVERGARPPRVDTLLVIAGALDCELIVALRPKTTAKEARP
jgi:transcriptional regulator with XRE-family HTH domain